MLALFVPFALALPVVLPLLSGLPTNDSFPALSKKIKKCERQKEGISYKNT